MDRLHRGILSNCSVSPDTGSSMICSRTVHDWPSGFIDLDDLHRRFRHQNAGRLWGGWIWDVKSMSTAAESKGLITRNYQISLLPPSTMPQK